ncbi:MAG: excinuclease ABC subunit UvrA, partial [Lentisphaeria bacterium]
MPDKNSEIIVQGARQHNLKNIDVRLPRNQLSVITGLSGSGKSSLAFDTLYAEGQRRYVESLSAYARQFLERLQKPDVEHIDGMSPAIAIEQRSASSNPRSIVATTTEIHDYLRLLYAHAGQPHCPKCGREVSGQSPQAITDHLLAIPEKTRFMLLAPFTVGRKGEHRDILEKMQRDGFVRARIDGEIKSLEDDITLEKNKRHTLEVVVDRLVSGKTSPARLNDSVELALRVGDGTITILVQDEQASGGWREETASEHLACEHCEISFGEMLPRNFSFNSPYGACPVCHGLGSRLVFLPDAVIPNPELSIKKGAIPLWRRGPRRLIIHYNRLLRCLAEHYGFDIKTPWKELPDEVRNVLLYGSGDEQVRFDYWRRGRHHERVRPFEGIVNNLVRRYKETESNAVRDRLRKSMTLRECDACKGGRLRPESLAVTVDGLSIHDFCELSVDKAVDFIDELQLTQEQQQIAADIVKEIRSRLQFLLDVGLEYLTLNRTSASLSGGEAQRIRLATQLGSGLTGVLYVLDEPTIGLHQRDNMRLLDTLKHLRDAGNTVIIVEHDPETIRSADYLIDLGPGAGRHGGELVCAGTPEQIEACGKSLTGQYLSGAREVPLPAERRSGNRKKITVVDAREHNLKKLKVALPLGTFCCVTGVSGSGKSTLVEDILKKAIYKKFGIRAPDPGRHTRINGLQHIDKMIVIDQSPIGKTPRSNPATYTDAFTLIRQLFAKTPDARMRGYKPGRFSFNVKGGRCEDCKGDGIKKIEMTFLPDVYVQCETCGGKRYNRETLNVLYRGRSIAEALEMTVDQALEFFDKVPRIKRKLQTLSSVGLGYIHLGQPATTLSGGEAQRVKLATELARKPKGHTLYILDEPTTGLHLDDISKLLDVLQTLRDQGNTVLIIEHNLDVIKVADHVIDLGPEGGDAGGELVVAGTPEEVAACEKSHTGRYLRDVL